MLDYGLDDYTDTNFSEIRKPSLNGLSSIDIKQQLLDSGVKQLIFNRNELRLIVNDDEIILIFDKKSKQTIRPSSDDTLNRNDFYTFTSAINNSICSL